MQQMGKSAAMTSIASKAVLAVVALLLMAGLACTGKSGRRAEEANKADQPNAAANTQASGGPGINLNCVYDRLKNPPDSFHYVYKKTSSDGFNVDQEADVTPQMIDGFRVQPDGSHQPIHGVRSDPESWQKALAGITGISGMSGTVSTFNNTSAMRRESDGGHMNGYDTIHYSIDTARWDATTRQMLGSFTLGSGGFDKGDAWVMGDGCPVKIVLDDEMHKKDGSLLGKVHYEVEMVKK